MLFLQPVVVNDASAADRTPPAEVRVAEERAPDQPPSWSGWSDSVLAQSSLDSRSPFGANATDRNDVTPPAPHTPTDTVTPPTTPGKPDSDTPADSMSTTKIPPHAPANTPDAGPPPPVSGSGATPGTTPAPTSTGGTTGTPAEPVHQPSSSTFPGAREGTGPQPGSGASNTR